MDLNPNSVTRTIVRAVEFANRNNGKRVINAIGDGKPSGDVMVLPPNVNVYYIAVCLECDRIPANTAQGAAARVKPFVTTVLRDAWCHQHHTTTGHECGTATMVTLK